MRVRTTLLSASMALILLVAGGSVALADGGPAANASCVAQCAVAIGGQHVTGCAQTMGQGASTCAR